MKIAQRPDNLGTGSLLFAPRLAPQLRANDDGFDLGLPELGGVPPEKIFALLAGLVEMRGQALPVLLLFVEGSRPLMIQAGKLRPGTFDIDSGSPLDNLRSVAGYLGETLDLVTDAATQRFVDGGDLPELGQQLIPVISWLGELVGNPERLAEALGAPGADTSAARGSKVPATASTQPERSSTSAEVSKSREPTSRDDISTPAPAMAADPGDETVPMTVPLGGSAPSTATPLVAKKRPAHTRMWLDLAHRHLVALGADYLLVARRSLRELEPRAEGIRSGKDPRVLFGTDALTIPFANLRSVRNMRSRSRLELHYSRSSRPIREVIDYSDPGEGEQMFEQLAAGLGPGWRRQITTQSRLQTLIPVLRWPIAAAGMIVMTMAAIAMRPTGSSGESGFGSGLNGFLGPYGLAVAAVVTLSLLVVPLVHGLRLGKSPIDELILLADVDSP